MDIRKLNKSLLAVLVVLLIVSCVGSVIAYSDDPSGSISQVDDDSIEDADDVISVSESSGDSSSSSSSGSSSSSVQVSLSNHATGNPLVLLLCALTVAGCYSTRRL